MAELLNKNVGLIYTGTEDYFSKDRFMFLYVYIF